MKRLEKIKTFDGKLWDTEALARHHVETKIANVKSKISHMIVGLSFEGAQKSVDDLRAFYQELAFLENDLVMEQDDD